MTKTVKYKDGSYFVVYELNDSKEWWLKGQLHNPYGPAIVWVNGNRYWHLNDRLVCIERAQ
jgi:hypothetical protein